MRAWELTVEAWNNAPHSRIAGKTRNQVYAEPMPKAEPFTKADIRRVFWLTTKEPRTYTRGGIKLAVGDQVFEYEVYDRDGLPDLAFREKYVGHKFYRRYDPDDFEQIELLQETSAGMQVVAVAGLKITHPHVPATMRDGEKARWSKHFDVRDREKAAAEARYAEIISRTGISNERLVAEQMAALSGASDDWRLTMKMKDQAPKEVRSEAEERESFLDEL